MSNPIEKFIEKKVDEMWVEFEIAEVDCVNFIRSIIEEMPIRKTSVDKEFVEGWATRWKEIDCYHEQAVLEMLKEAGYEVVKPVTEKWIEEKAVELYNYLYYETFNLDQVRGFIRLLVKEMKV